MRRIVFHALALLVCASAALAAKPTYQQLRAEHPSIDAIVGSMPATGLHGSLDRLSSLVGGRDLANARPGTSSTLPTRIVKQVEGALDRVEHDLRTGLPALDLREQLVIAQVVDVIAFETLVPIHADQPWVDCDGRVDCDNAPIMEALDEIGAVLVEEIHASLEQWRREQGLPSQPRPEVHPDAFSAFVDDVMTETAAAGGVESIDG